MRRLAIVAHGKPYDLVAVCAIVLVGVVLAYAAPGNPITWLFALLSIYFCPGYAITSMLFPGNRVIITGRLLVRKGAMYVPIPFLERVVLSIALSVSAVAIIGVLLTVRVDLLSIASVSVELLLLTVGGSLLALRFRSRLPQEEQFQVALDVDLSLRGLTTAEKGVVVLVVSGFLISAFLAAIGTGGPGDEERFTEFYITGEGGNLTNLPLSVFVGENATVNVTVKNAMGTEIAYNFTIGALNGTSFDVLLPIEWDEVSSVAPGVAYQEQIVIGDGAVYEKTFRFSASSQGSYKLLFIIDYEGKTQELWIWLTVAPAP